MDSHKKVLCSVDIQHEFIPTVDLPVLLCTPPNVSGTPDLHTKVDGALPSWPPHCIAGSPDLSDTQIIKGGGTSAYSEYSGLDGLGGKGCYLL